MLSERPSAAEDSNSSLERSNSYEIVLPPKVVHLSIYWPLDKACYNEKVDGVTEGDNKICTTYETEGDKNFVLANKKWKLNQASTSCRPINFSQKNGVLSLMLYYFGNRGFSQFKAQRLPSRLLPTACNEKEVLFKKTVRTVPIAKVPKTANVIRFLVSNKVKIFDAETYKLKSRKVSLKSEKSKINEL